MVFFLSMRHYRAAGFYIFQQQRADETRQAHAGEQAEVVEVGEQVGL
jgi:hypothetical protein